MQLPFIIYFAFGIIVAIILELIFEMMLAIFRKYNQEVNKVENEIP